MDKHPVLRRARNEERMNRLDLLKKLGRATPKKGAGKKSKKK